MCPIIKLIHNSLTKPSPAVSLTDSFALVLRCQLCAFDDGYKCAVILNQISCIGIDGSRISRYLGSHRSSVPIVGTEYHILV